MHEPASAQALARTDAVDGNRRLPPPHASPSQPDTHPKVTSPPSACHPRHPHLHDAYSAGVRRHGQQPLLWGTATPAPGPTACQHSQMQRWERRPVTGGRIPRPVNKRTNSYQQCAYLARAVAAANAAAAAGGGVAHSTIKTKTRLAQLSLPLPLGHPPPLRRNPHVAATPCHPHHPHLRVTNGWMAPGDGPQPSRAREATPVPPSRRLPTSTPTKQPPATRCRRVATFRRRRCAG